jgi:hypothetical protein
MLPWSFSEEAAAEKYAIHHNRGRGRWHGGLVLIRGLSTRCRSFRCRREELLLGAWLAATNVRDLAPRRFIPALQWVGAAMIGIAAVSYDRLTPQWNTGEADYRSGRSLLQLD